MKPRIGLNADFYLGEGGRRRKDYHKLYADYTRGVVAGGGIPLIIPAMEDADDAAAVLSSLDGLLLTGGRDIDPAHYGAAAHPAEELSPPERQRGDIILARAALSKPMPVFGICLGCQLINVIQGGTLVQDIPSEVQTGVAHDPGEADSVRHMVKIAAGTLLGEIVGRGEIEADSSHHQAIKELGKDLVASARAQDDVIEAVELARRGTTARWVLGVQWHPERLIDVPVHRALFAAFVAAAGRCKS